MENERLKYGGQAVIEGVMMRSPRYFAVACRRETDGKIVVRVENVESALKGWQWLDKPFLRGTLALIDSMFMGAKALLYSAGVQIEAEDQKQKLDGVSISDYVPNKDERLAKESIGRPINNIAIGSTFLIAIVVSVAVFYGLPTVVTQLIAKHYHWTTATFLSGFKLNLLDAMIRLFFFLGYVLAIGQMKNVKRIFQYHGAEHKAINTLEFGNQLNLANARESSRIHPRCGTNFIFIVLIVHFFVIALFGRPDNPLERVLINLAVLPLVAGISYEILKFAGSNRDKAWAQAMIAPGLATQYLTTRVPDDSQIEVALASLQAVWDKEHETPETPVEIRFENPVERIA